MIHLFSKINLCIILSATTFAQDVNDTESETVLATFEKSDITTEVSLETESTSEPEKQELQDDFCVKSHLTELMKGPFTACCTDSE